MPDVLLRAIGTNISSYVFNLTDPVLGAPAGGTCIHMPSSLTCRLEPEVGLAVSCRVVSWAVVLAVWLEGLGFGEEVEVDLQPLLALVRPLPMWSQ